MRTAFLAGAFSKRVTNCRSLDPICVLRWKPPRFPRRRKSTSSWRQSRRGIGWIQAQSCQKPFKRSQPRRLDSWSMKCSVIAGTSKRQKKSSLLNALSREESAIVTNIEGTTRLTSCANISSRWYAALHIIDPPLALRDSPDEVGAHRYSTSWDEIRKPIVF